MDVITNDVAGTSSINLESIYSNLYDQIYLKSTQVQVDPSEQNSIDNQILFIARNHLDFNIDFSKKERHAKKNSVDKLDSSFKCAGSRKIGELDAFLQRAGDTTSKKISLNDSEQFPQWDMQSINSIKPKKKNKKM